MSGHAFPSPLLEQAPLEGMAPGASPRSDGDQPPPPSLAQGRDLSSPAAAALLSSTTASSISGMSGRRKAVPQALELSPRSEAAAHTRRPSAHQTRAATESCPAAATSSSPTGSSPSAAATAPAPSSRFTTAGTTATTSSPSSPSASGLSSLLSLQAFRPNPASSAPGRPSSGQDHAASLPRPLSPPYALGLDPARDQEQPTPQRAQTTKEGADLSPHSTPLSAAVPFPSTPDPPSPSSIDRRGLVGLEELATPRWVAAGGSAWSSPDPNYHHPAGGPPPLPTSVVGGEGGGGGGGGGGGEGEWDPRRTIGSSEGDSRRATMLLMTGAVFPHSTSASSLGEAVAAAGTAAAAAVLAAAGVAGGGGRYDRDEAEAAVANRRAKWGPGPSATSSSTEPPPPRRGSAVDGLGLGILDGSSSAVAVHHTGDFHNNNGEEPNSPKPTPMRTRPVTYSNATRGMSFVYEAPSSDEKQRPSSASSPISTSVSVSTFESMNSGGGGRGGGSGPPTPSFGTSKQPSPAPTSSTITASQSRRHSHAPSSLPASPHEVVTRHFAASTHDFSHLPPSPSTLSITQYYKRQDSAGGLPTSSSGLIQQQTSHQHTQQQQQQQQNHHHRVKSLDPEVEAEVLRKLDGLGGRSPDTRSRHSLKSTKSSRSIGSANGSGERGERGGGGDGTCIRSRPGTPPAPSSSSRSRPGSSGGRSSRGARGGTMVPASADDVFDTSLAGSSPKSATFNATRASTGGSSFFSKRGSSSSTSIVNSTASTVASSALQTQRGSSILGASGSVVAGGGGGGPTSSTRVRRNSNGSDVSSLHSEGAEYGASKEDVPPVPPIPKTYSIGSKGSLVNAAAGIGGSGYPASQQQQPGTHLATPAATPAHEASSLSTTSSSQPPTPGSAVPSSLSDFGSPGAASSLSGQQSVYSTPTLEDMQRLNEADDRKAAALAAQQQQQQQPRRVSGASLSGPAASDSLDPSPKAKAAKKWSFSSALHMKLPTSSSRQSLSSSTAQHLARLTGGGGGGSNDDHHHHHHPSSFSPLQQQQSNNNVAASSPHSAAAIAFPRQVDGGTSPTPWSVVERPNSSDSPSNGSFRGRPSYESRTTAGSGSRVSESTVQSSNSLHAVSPGMTTSGALPSSSSSSNTSRSMSSKRLTPSSIPFFRRSSSTSMRDKAGGVPIVQQSAQQQRASMLPPPSVPSSSSSSSPRHDPTTPGRTPTGASASMASSSAAVSSDATPPQSARKSMLGMLKSSSSRRSLAATQQQAIHSTPHTTPSSNSHNTNHNSGGGLGALGLSASVGPSSTSGSATTGRFGRRIKVSSTAEALDSGSGAAGEEPPEKEKGQGRLSSMSLLGRRRGKTISSTEKDYPDVQIHLPPMQMAGLSQSTIDRVRSFNKSKTSSSPESSPKPVSSSSSSSSATASMPRKISSTQGSLAARPADVSRVSRSHLATITGSPSASVPSSGNASSVSTPAPNVTSTPSYGRLVGETPTKIPRIASRQNSQTITPSSSQQSIIGAASRRSSVVVTSSMTTTSSRMSRSASNVSEFGTAIDEPTSGMAPTAAGSSSSTTASTTATLPTSASARGFLTDPPSSLARRATMQLSSSSSSASTPASATALTPATTATGSITARTARALPVPPVSSLSSASTPPAATVAAPVATKKSSTITASMPPSSLRKLPTSKTSSASVNDLSQYTSATNPTATPRTLTSKLSIPASSRIPGSSSSPAISSAAAGASSRSSSASPSVVDDDEESGDREMREFMKRQRSRKAASGATSAELEAMMNFPEPVEPTPPQSPLATMKSSYSALSDFERKEVVDYPNVFFIGAESAKKASTRDESTNNHGYDDERGDYLVVDHDHLAYRYEIIGLLGKGSFGQVLQCQDHKTGGSVAIKIIRNKKRFHHQALVEVKILDNLRKWDPDEKHNVIRMTEHFYFRNHLCIATELLSINLYELIKANSFQGFSTILIRRFTTQLLASLILLRHHRIVHCDLKPENVLLSHPSKSGVKVIDFGSSCFEHEKVYTYIQSRFYRSPEVILGQNYHFAIDMWSLGCILAELYTGFPIFPGENEQEQLSCIMEVLGLPEKYLVDKSSRKNLFFDTQGAPRPVVNSKGKRRRPGTKTLAQVLKSDDELFVDFISKCLLWDPERRLKPQPALRHPWIQQRRAMAAATRDRLQSPAPSVTGRILNSATSSLASSLRSKPQLSSSTSTQQHQTQPHHGHHPQETPKKSGFSIGAPTPLSARIRPSAGITPSHQGIPGASVSISTPSAYRARVVGSSTGAGGSIPTSASARNLSYGLSKN